MERDKIECFYDEFSRKLIADYVYGNPRVEAAIQHCLRWIPAGAKRILDIGCGIGWTTWEFKRHRPRATVLGVDLSPKSIEIAKILFQNVGLQFIAHDITEWSVALEPTFDAIVMCDVYEHIPTERCTQLYMILEKALAPDGKLLLTFPSVAHQNYLRQYKPEALQPVDEDVTQEDLAEMARALRANVACYKPVHIWDTHDYIHAVIDRSAGESPSNDSEIAIETKAVRRSRVASNLRVRVTPDGDLLQSRGSPRVCIISPHQNAYSETFIRAHIERLPAHVDLLYCDFFPLYEADGNQPLAPQWIRLASRGLDRFLKRSSFSGWVDRVTLHKYLKKKQVSAVLAEFGSAAVRVMDACFEVGVPLIVHFHGYDAYERTILTTVGKDYPRLFMKCAAMIAVSRDMEQQLLALGAERGEIHYNPYGVDLEQFSSADPGSAPPHFVAVGRFVDKKAPHLTLLAFRKVVELCPEARLIMIGDGPLWEACKQLTQALGIAGKVEFLGPRSHGEVALAMRHGRAFVQHSVRTTFGDSEGTPVAVLEACASGLPVVSTRHAGIKDVVLDGKTGLLVDEGDIEGMADCMTRLANDPALAAHLGRAGRSRICAEFSMEKSIDGLWRVIAEAVQGHQRS